MKKLLLFFFPFLLLITSASYALNISKNDENSIVLEGKIEKGDYLKISNYLQNKYTTGAFLLNKIILNSTGGDITEALLISNLIKTASGYTKVPEDGLCFSACFIIWSGGVTREIEKNGKLGVHRMTLTDENATVLQSEKILKPLSNTVDGYLLGVGIPRIIIDKMNETPPSDIFIIDQKWIFNNELDYAISFMPFFIDVAEKKCGQNSYIQFKKDSKKVGYDELVKWTKCINDFRRQNAMDNILSFIELIAPEKK